MRRPINTVNGYYKDPGKHWSAQDALNVLVRMAEKSGTRTVSRLVDAPGLRPFCRIGTNGGGEVGFTPSGAGRGMRVVDGRLFVVAGRTLWQITADGVSVPYGTIPGVGRVSMTHTQRGNGFELSIDNTQSRYVFNTLTQSLQKVTDESFPGSMRAFAIDGYTGYLEPQGLYWGHSDLANALNYIAFDTYEAEGQPDRIVSATVDNNRQVLIIGQQTTEIYLNQGSAQAPFVRASNTIIPYGSAARDSVQNFGSGTVLLDQNRVVRILSTGDDRISTSVIDSALQECTRQQIANAYSFTLEGDGFQIYYLTVPGKFTFGFDFVNREWHRRSSTDLDWWAVADVVQWNGKWYALDSRVGEIFEVRWRDYPFDGQKELVREWVTGSVSADQNPVYVHELELLFGCGGQAYTTVDFPDQPIGPQISGSAPDGPTGSPYTFTYTTTPGDSPIARTVLLETVLPTGWLWDASTATISATNPTFRTISLRMRVFDENGLFADHEDTLVISENYTVIIAGAFSAPGQPVICTTESLGEIAFVGIPQSTGANISGAVVAEYNGTWALVNQTAARYSTNPVSTWSSGTISAARPINNVIGGPGGWMALAGNNYPCQVHCGATPAAFSLTDPQTTDPTKQSALDSIYRGWRVGDTYFLMYPRTLFTTTDPVNANYTLSYDVLSSPNESDLLTTFLDMVMVDGSWITPTLTYGNDSQVRGSESLSSWPTPEILMENPVTDGHVPYEICVSRIDDDTDVIVALCVGGGVRCSNNNWEWIDIGIAGATSAEIDNVPGGRRMAPAGNKVFIVGAGTDANKCVVFNPATHEFSAPYTLPITAATSIAARLNE